MFSKRRVDRRFGERQLDFERKVGRYGLDQEGVKEGVSQQGEGIRGEGRGVGGFRLLT